MDRPGALHELGGASEAPGDANGNLRGREVLDRSGELVGAVDGLLVDAGERRVRFLRVVTGEPLPNVGRHFLVPIEAVARVEADRVHLDILRERIVSAPPYDRGRVDPPEYYAQLADYYGTGPTAVPGVTTPAEPSAS